MPDPSNRLPTHFHLASLVQIALTFVASHLSSVESLDGFPDEVGRQLFEEARRIGSFRSPELCVDAFKLFSEAYGSTFVSNLSLSKVTISSFVCEIVTKSCASALNEIHLRGKMKNASQYG